VFIDGEATVMSLYVGRLKVSIMVTRGHWRSRCAACDLGWLKNIPYKYDTVFIRFIR
jgi:hypothetical protein